MPDQSLRVVARLQALPEKIDEVRSLLAGVVGPSRDENGCLAYDLLQNKQDPTEFIFVEEWTGSDALYAHLHTSHVRGVLEQMGDLFQCEPDIRSYQVVDSAQRVD